MFPGSIQALVEAQSPSSGPTALSWSTALPSRDPGTGWELRVLHGAASQGSSLERHSELPSIPSASLSTELELRAAFCSTDSCPLGMGWNPEDLWRRRKRPRGSMPEGEQLWALPHSPPEPPFLTLPWESPPSFASTHPAPGGHGAPSPIQQLQESPWALGELGVQPDYQHCS